MSWCYVVRDFVIACTVFIRITVFKTCHNVGWCNCKRLIENLAIGNRLRSASYVFLTAYDSRNNRYNYDVHRCNWLRTLHIMLYFWDTIKLFKVPVPEMTFKSHSKSSATSSFIRSPCLDFLWDQKSRLHLFSNKNRRNYPKGRSKSSAMTQFNRPHWWSVVTVTRSCTVSETFNAE